MNFKYIIIAIIFLLSYNFLVAHNHTIIGKIESNNGENSPIPGATVRIENTALRTISNSKGEFKLKHIPDGKFNLIISAVGFKTQNFSIEFEHTEGDDIKEFNISMEEVAISTPDLVVTATRSEKIYEDTPVKLSVVSQSILKSTTSLNIKEGLSFQPGLRVENTCQNCGVSQIRINGLEGHYTQVLIDSRPIFSALNGVYGLEQIPSIMIDRIEVVRGGGSSLYGSSAIAGIVNVITKDPSINYFSGSYIQSFTDGKTPDNTFQMNASLVNDNQDIGVYFYGLNRNRKEWDANGDGFCEIPKLDLTTFGVKAFYKPTYKTKFSGEYNIINDDRRGGNKLNLPEHEADITEAARHKTHIIQLSSETFFTTYDKFSIYASGQFTERKSYYGAEQNPDAYGNTKNRTAVAGLQYSHISDNFIYGQHIFTIGYEFRNDNIEDEALGYDRIIKQDVVENGIFLQDDWSLTENVSLIFGGRFDKHNLIDKFIFSPRANVLYKIVDNLSVRANFSTGFRSPQAFDEDLHITIVNGGGQVIRLANNLKEERSYTYGASFDWFSDSKSFPFAVSFDFFSTMLRDAFVLEETGTDDKGNMIMERRNGRDANINGFTLELQSNVKSILAFKTGFTYQNSKYDEPFVWSSGDEKTASQSTDKLLRAPDLYGYFTFTLNPFEDIGIDISGVYTGKMYVPHYKTAALETGEEIIIDELVFTDPFFELNLKATYKLNQIPSIEIFAGVQNLLNSFQTDFDIGVTRDAGFVYGPSRPTTVLMGMKIEL